MIKLTQRMIKSLEDSAYEELALDIYHRNVVNYDEISLGDVKEHISKARKYNLAGKENITIYVEAVIAIENNGVDPTKIDRFMQNESLSIDHKLIPLSMLAKTLG